jgi:hypothetical protein
MISHNILHPLLITNFNIKLVEKKDLTDKRGLASFLAKRYLMAA